MFSTYFYHIFLYKLLSYNQVMKKENNYDVQLKCLNLQKVIKPKENLRIIEGESAIQPQVKKAIDCITNKMAQSKLSELHPPFFTKTLSKFRSQYYLPLRKTSLNKLIKSNSSQFLKSLKTLNSFITNLDLQYFDVYMEQIREPYIRKLFSQNYQFNQIDLKQLNTQYKIRGQIENFLNCASQWLIQIERTQDLLDRIELYFELKTPLILQKAKKEGLELGGERTWMDSFLSIVRNVSSYTLRKSSKIIQSSFFTAVAPAAAMLTFAIIGGNTLPWQGSMNSKMLLAPALAITLPYLLDGLASTVQAKQYREMLQQWTISLEGIAKSVSNFNQELQQQIITISLSKNSQEYEKQLVNLEKIVGTLGKNMKGLMNYDQEAFQDMKDRTQAYFKRYIQMQEGQWTVVIPEEQFADNLKIDPTKK